MVELYHQDLENSNSFVENAFNPIYSKNLLPNPLLMSEHMKFGCNVSKDTWLKKKQSSLHSFENATKLQQCLQENSVFKYDLFWVFLTSLVFTHSNFMNVLILGSDHINCA